MGSQYWVALLTIGFFIIIVAFLIAFCFLVYSALQLKKMALALNDFCRTTDEKLRPLIEETEKTMMSIRVIADDVGAVTGSVREVSEAVSDVAANIHAVSMLIGEAREQLSLRALGIKAGVQTALSVLLKHHK